MSEAVGDVEVILTLNASSVDGGIRKVKSQLKDYGLQVTKVDQVIKASGGHQVAAWQASSAALRVVEGNMTNNIRAAERFLATIPGVGKALQAAFPVVGAIALLGVFSKLVGEVKEFIEKTSEAPRKLELGFREMNDAAQLTDDRLHLVNDKLRNQIAILEKKPVNNVAIALDEARINADRLSESLQHDMDKMSTLMKQQQIGFLGKVVTGKDSTTAVSGMVNYYNSQLADLANEKEIALHDPSKSKSDIANIEKQYQDKRLAFEKNLRAEISMRTGSGFDLGGKRAGYSYGAMYGDQSANLNILKGVLGNLLTGDDIARQEVMTPDLQARESKLRREKTEKRHKDPRPEEIKKYHQYMDDLIHHQDSTGELGDRMVRSNSSQYAEKNTKIAEASDRLTKAMERSALIASAGGRTVGIAQAREDFGSGKIDAHELAMREMAVNAAAFKEAVDSLTARLREIKSYTPKDKAGLYNQQAQSQDVQNEIDRLKIANTVQQMEAAQKAQSETSRGAAMQASADYFRQFDRGNMAANVTGGTLSTVNDHVAQFMSTGKGNFSGMFRELSGMASKNGLGFLESKVSKLFGGGKAGESQSKPVWVKNADRAASVAAAMPGSGMETTISSLKNLVPGGSGGGAGGAFQGVMGALGSVASLIPGGSIISGILSHFPKFASGGAISTGLPAIIGENGPELFVPHTSGRIVPNHALGGGGQTIHVDARGATDPAATAMAVQRAIRQSEQRAGHNAMVARHEVKARTVRR